MQVEIRHYQRETWYEKLSDRSFAQPLSFMARIDETGHYQIGIEPKDLEEIQSKNPQWDLSTQAVPGQQHPFWDSMQMRVRLERASVNVREIKTDIDRLWLGVVKGSGLVAPSLDELQNYPNAEFYIYNEYDEVSRQTEKSTLIMNALAKLDELSEDTRRYIARLLTKKPLVSQSNDFVKTVLFQEINKDPKAFLEYSNLSTERAMVLTVIEDAIDRGHLHRVDGQILYGTDRLGFDRGEAADFLMRPENQPMLLRLRQVNG